MRMKFFVLFGWGGLLLLAGCATSVVQSTPPLPGQLSDHGSRVVTNLKAANTGYYLFYCIPLVSGSVSFPNYRAYDFFSDNVKEKNIYRMLERQCAKDKADAVEDIQLRADVSGWIGLGIVWQKTLTALAVAVKKE